MRVNLCIVERPDTVFMQEIVNCTWTMAGSYWTDSKGWGILKNVNDNGTHIFSISNSIAF